MRTVKGLRAGGVAAILIGVGLTFAAGTVSAEQERFFTTERPSSILIFPKVINVGNRETTIQMTNTSNLTAHAHCFYVNGASFAGEPLWTIVDFRIWLTRQQPTHWPVGEGRVVNPVDDVGGIDPGGIPPVPPGFTGALVCVQVNSDGMPVSANALKGEATITSNDNGGPPTIRTGAKYNAIGIEGLDGNDGDNELLLDNLEYAACPAGMHLNFVGEGAQDDLINAMNNPPSVVSTTLSFVPCSMDFENLVPGSTSLFVEIWDEFETRGSVTSGIPVDCWRSINLGDPILGNEMTADTLSYGYARFTAVGPAGGDPVGAVGVAHVQRIGGNGAVDTAATNLHFLGNKTALGECTIRDDPDTPIPCSDDAGCEGGNGFCAGDSLDEPPSVIRLPR